MKKILLLLIISLIIGNISAQTTLPLTYDSVKVIRAGRYLKLASKTDTGLFFTNQKAFAFNKPLYSEGKKLITTTDTTNKWLPKTSPSTNSNLFQGKDSSYYNLSLTRKIKASDTARWGSGSTDSSKLVTKYDLANGNLYQDVIINSQNSESSFNLNNSNVTIGSSSVINLNAPDIFKNGTPLSTVTYAYVDNRTIWKDSSNIHLGQDALKYKTTGFSNVAIGDLTLKNTTTGYFNIGLGSASLLSNTTGYGNVANGAGSLTNNTTGYNNIAIGYYAGQNPNLNNRLYINSLTRSNVLEDTTKSIIYGYQDAIITNQRLYLNANTFVSGNLTPSNRLMIPMGEISYFNLTGTTITISGTSNGSSNMVKAAPTTTLSNDMDFDNGGANDGRLRYIGSATRTFHVACTISFSGTTTNENGVFGIAKNNAVIASSKVLPFLGLTTDTRSTALHVMVSLSTNDYLELYVGNISGAHNIIIKTLNLFAMGM